MKTPKPLGRPPLPDHLRKVSFTVRLTPADGVLLRLVGAARLSAWLRRCQLPDTAPNIQGSTPPAPIQTLDRA